MTTTAKKRLEVRAAVPGDVRGIQRMIARAYPGMPNYSLATIRGQINIWDDFNVERTEFGDRIARPIAFVENRFVDPRTFYQIRLRKTF